MATRFLSAIYVPFDPLSAFDRAVSTAGRWQKLVTRLRDRGSR
jgi:hypothetical protein